MCLLSFSDVLIFRGSYVSLGSFNPSYFNLLWVSVPGSSHSDMMDTEHYFYKDFYFLQIKILFHYSVLFCLFIIVILFRFTSESLSLKLHNLCCYKSRTLLVPWFHDRFWRFLCSPFRFLFLASRVSYLLLNPPNYYWIK